MNWLAVFVGGGLGSIVRFGFSKIFQTLPISSLPLATLAANVISTAILGYLLYKVSLPISHWSYHLLAIGFCGGFSTFSTFSLETIQLLRNDQILWATMNVLISLLFCFLVLYLLSKSLK